jgi:hypothetical protein
MEQILKEKLWNYIVHNNPELMLGLQREYSVSKFLDEKLSGIQVLLETLQSKDTPSYIIEETCLNTLTEDFKPSRFLFLRSLLEEEFEKEYASFREAGILTYEVVNLITWCAPIFENFGFTADNEEDPLVRNAMIGQLADYLN